MAALLGWHYLLWRHYTMAALLAMALLTVASLTMALLTTQVPAWFLIEREGLGRVSADDDESCGDGRGDDERGGGKKGVKHESAPLLQPGVKAAAYPSCCWSDI